MFSLNIDPHFEYCRILNYKNSINQQIFFLDLYAYYFLVVLQELQNVFFVVNVIVT